MPRTVSILSTAIHIVFVMVLTLLLEREPLPPPPPDLNLVIGVSNPVLEPIPYDAPDVEWVEPEPEYRKDRVVPPDWKSAVHVIPDFSRPSPRVFDRVPGADREEIAPVEVFTPPPSYPRMARRRGYEGVLVIEFMIRTDGSCSAVRVAESSGHPVLDEAAVSAVLLWRYKPRQKPVQQRVRIVFEMS